MPNGKQGTTGNKMQGHHGRQGSQVLDFFLTTYPHIDIFYGISVDEKITVFDYLPTYSCKPSTFMNNLGVPLLRMGPL